MMNRIVFCVLSLLSLVPNIKAHGQSRTVTQSGLNSITVTTYAPRDLTDDKLPVAMLKEEWDTDREVRWDLSAVLALLAEQSYSDDDETLDYLIRGMGFSKWVAIRNSTMAAHVISGHDVAVIVFRGTNPTEIPDWYKNLSVAFVSTRQGRFHSGFTDAYKMLRSDVRAYIDEVAPTKVWITGHSLGGAMAVACGVDLILNTKMKPHLVTFGQPRYADSTGAQWIDEQFDSHYARFVCGDDIVPSVPFYVRRVFPYAHAGNLIAIHNDGISLAESITSTPAVGASYCGTCGRPTMSSPIEVYQPSIEPPPLIEAEYIASLHLDNFILNGSHAEAMSVQLIPRYIRDHSMSASMPFSFLSRFRSWSSSVSDEPRE